MQLNPFPWQLTQECLKSLLRYAFDMKEFHHCMHVYGGTLFNYWRHYLHEHCSDDKMKDVIEKCLFANTRERYRAVWMLREDNRWIKLATVSEWCDDYNTCVREANAIVSSNPTPSIDYPEKQQPKDMEVVLTIESECAECHDSCSCQPAIRCPIKNIYDIPYGFRGNVQLFTSPRGLTYAYTHDRLKNTNVDHFVINGAHILRELDENSLSAKSEDYSYYIATYDEWFKSKESCPILAFEQFLELEKWPCWNDPCPCSVE